MELKYLAGIALATLAFASCDDNTDGIGTSVVNNMDHLEVSADTFTVASRSIIVDSVLSRNTIGYLGKIRDPETGAYITGDYMTQFHTLEDYTFPSEDSIVNRINGKFIADSCEIRLFYTDFYGDSLNPMKLKTYELDHPMLENKNYYSNFDPMSQGYVRTDGKGIQEDKMYTLTDLNTDKSSRESSDYTPNIVIPLNKEYTDKNGKKYHNYGTYIMQMYYDHPEYFKNSYQFIKNVVPGFYFKYQSGLGSMAYVSNSQLNIYFKYHTLNDSQRDTVYVGTTSFSGTEEVLQHTKVTNDGNTIQRLAADKTCTYLKTPAGIFTELTLPVNEICNGHENDSINIAKVTLTRLNSESQSIYNLDIPQTIMMIPRDSLYSFFENAELPNNKNSYLAAYSSTGNTYTFANISGMISAMNKSDKTSPNWNKVVIIPVTATYTTSSSSSYYGTSSKVLTKVVHDMSLTSTKLVGGSGNPNDPIQISVIYSKYK